MRKTEKEMRKLRHEVLSPKQKCIQYTARYIEFVTIIENEPDKNKIIDLSRSKKKES